MFGKLSVALLILATPAFAQEAPPGNQAEGAAEAPAPKVAYKTKKICRSIEVVGSSIPKTSCTTKRIPIEPVEQDQAEGQPAPEADPQV